MEKGLLLDELLKPADSVRANHATCKRQCEVQYVTCKRLSPADVLARATAWQNGLRTGRNGRRANNGRWGAMLGFRRGLSDQVTN